MFVDDIHRGDVFVAYYYGVNIFLYVIDVFQDNTVEVKEIATNHWKTSNAMFKKYREANPNDKMSKTGYVELLRYPFKTTSKKERLLYQSINRVPYFEDKETGDIEIAIPISKQTRAYKKASVIYENTDETVKPGFYSAYRIHSLLNYTDESFDKMINTFYPYYSIPEKKIQNCEDCGTSQLVS